jgi:hypothetical protein
VRSKRRLRYRRSDGKRGGKRSTRRRRRTARPGLDTRIGVTLCETGWWLDRAWPQLVRCALANTCALFLKVRRRKENGCKPEEKSEDRLEDRMKSDEVRRSDGPESG